MGLKCHFKAPKKIIKYILVILFNKLNAIFVVDLMTWLDSK